MKKGCTENKSALILGRMKTADAIASFGTTLALAQALGITREAIYQWGDDVPPLREYQIREIAKRDKPEIAPGAEKVETA